jgi:Domain of unknown function (DUF4861)
MQTSRTLPALCFVAVSCGAPERPPQAPSPDAVSSTGPASSAAASAAPLPAPAGTASGEPMPAAPRPLGISIEVKNPLGVARSAETISLVLAELQKLSPSLQLGKTVVQHPDGSALISQLIDSDGDETPDTLVFQTDLGPNETRHFELGEGVRSLPSADQFKVYGRFVRERHDDFAWENERMAHRMYGPALETWAREPLTSSGIDIWVKRTPRRVINDWYQSDDYHRDNGEGGDFYSVGPSRGCGGVGIWDGKQLHVSRNFQSSRVLANGPIRLIFELDYAPWNAGGAQVSETKRVTVDAGARFDRFESRLELHGKASTLALAIGIGKHANSAFEADPQNGVLRSWEPFGSDNGHVGCALILSSGPSTSVVESRTDQLLLTPLPNATPVVYLAGFGWDKGGDVPDSASWAQRVTAAAESLHHPVSVALTRASDQPTATP